MKRILRGVLALVLMLPAKAQCQTWSPEQKEVWDALITCWNAKELEPYRACVHDDYQTFGSGRNVPAGKTDVLANVAERLETVETIWDNSKPMNIDIRGNVAVVLYISDWRERNTQTGEVTRGTTNWTEVWVKEDGRWQCLTDHGREVGES